MTLEDYLSCEIIFLKGGHSACLGQPHLIKKLEKKFGDPVKKLRRYKTPGTPGLNMVSNLDPQDSLDKRLYSN